MPKFGQFKFAEEKFGTESVTVPSDVEETRIPWLFTDYSLSQVYEFAINPIEADFPLPQKTITTKATCAGQLVRYEGRKKPAVMSFSGTILTEEQYLVIKAWTAEEKQIQITDDLGRKYWVYLTSFSPTRHTPYNGDFPWRMEYQAAATVLDWGNT